MILSFVLVIGATASLWIVFRWWRRRRYELLFQRPLPTFAIEIVKHRMPAYSLLPDGIKAQLHGRINQFLAGKSFVGCNGLEISDEIRLVIAANACLLVLNRSGEIFPGFTTILVYPDTFIVNQVTHDGLVETRGPSSRLGESWRRGPVVLSWADVVAGSANPDDGHNVVLHEFAHKLDEENALMDGLPVLRDRRQYADWARVLSQEFEAFRERVRRHRNRVIDEYGALSAAEFFAVITEAFFEKPLQMRDQLPELYSQLQDYYGLDPAAWRSGPN